MLSSVIKIACVCHTEILYSSYDYFASSNNLSFFIATYFTTEIQFRDFSILQIVFMTYSEMTMRRSDNACLLRSIPPNCGWSSKFSGLGTYLFRFEGLLC